MLIFYGAYFAAIDMLKGQDPLGEIKRKLHILAPADPLGGVLLLPLDTILQTVLLS